MKNFLLFLLLSLSTTMYATIDCTTMAMTFSNDNWIAISLPTTPNCDNPTVQISQRIFGSGTSFTPSSFLLNVAGTAARIGGLEPCTEYQFLVELLCDGVVVGGCVNGAPYSTTGCGLSCDECINLFGIEVLDIDGCDATFVLDYNFNDCGPITVISEIWSFGGSGTSVTNTFPSNGTFPVSATITYQMGNGEICTATANTTVTITDCDLSCDECINLFGIEVLDIDGCDATFVLDYSFNDCGPITVISEIWSFGGSGTSVTNTFPSNGTFPVSATITYQMGNGEICTATANTTVTITDCFNCDDCINLFGLEIVDIEECTATFVLDYNFNDCGPITILNHFWNFGEGAGFGPGGFSESHTYSSNGTFTVTGFVFYLMGNGEFCFASASTTVTITDCEEDCLTTIPTGLACQYFGSQLQLIWDEVPGATCYVISIEPDNPDPNAKKCCKTPTTFLPFAVSVIGNKVNASPNWPSCFRWRVQACCGDNTYSPFSNYRCQSAFSDCPIVGKPGRGDDPAQAEFNVNLNDLKVFPNPSSDHFNIALNFETPQMINIRIMDSTGKLVYSTGQKSVDAGEFLEEWTPDSQLANGLYILEISTDEQIIREKMILQR